MTTAIDRKLDELGLTLPEPAAPVAAYVPAVEAGGLLHLSGQLPFKDGALVKKGDLLFVIDLSGVDQVVKLGVFVSSAAGFTDQPKVANGASELMVALFGEAGRHARSAVGVSALPLGAAVEVDAILALR